MSGNYGVDVCGRGCFIYDCPTTGERECLHHGGFDRCCDDLACPANGKTKVIPRPTSPAQTAEIDGVELRHLNTPAAMAGGPDD